MSAIVANSQSLLSLFDTPGSMNDGEILVWNSGSFIAQAYAAPPEDFTDLGDVDGPFVNGDFVKFDGTNFVAGSVFPTLQNGWFLRSTSSDVEWVNITPALIGAVSTSEANDPNGYAALDSSGDILAGVIPSSYTDTLQLRSERGASNGYCPLNASGHVPSANLDLAGITGGFELTTNKNVNNGYAGLNATGHIDPARIVGWTNNGSEVGIGPATSVVTVTATKMTTPAFRIVPADGPALSEAGDIGIHQDGLDFEVRVFDGTDTVSLQPKIEDVLNLNVLSADPASPNDGDVWIFDDTADRAIRVRIDGVTYETALTAV